MSNMKYTSGYATDPPTEPKVVPHVVPPNNFLQGRITKHLAFAIFVCVFGSSFQFGYNSGVMNMPDDVNNIIYIVVVFHILQIVRSWLNESYARHNGVAMTDAL